MIEYMCSHDSYDPVAKEIAHKIKGENIYGYPISDRERNEAITIAAREMSVFVPKNTVLIPVPSKHGYATDTLLLANEISKHTGAVVMDVLKGNDRASSYLSKKEGCILSDEDFGFFMTKFVDGNIIYIDNVIASGATARAVYNVKRGIFLVFAAKKKIKGFLKRGRTILSSNNPFCRQREMTRRILC